jgi:YegS/Rv2252/BmrU family lipid kinase
MRADVIVNPIAGAGRSGLIHSATALATHVLGSAGYRDVIVSATGGPGHAEQLAREASASGASLVVAWGGDGTVNGVASALVHTDVPLGIVPAGSGNGLARDLGLPLDTRAALDTAARGRDAVIDAAQIGDALFFNVAGIGLDAVIARRLAAPQARRGLAGYILATVSELQQYEARTYSMRLDGEPWDGRALFIALANSRQYGSGAQIAPRARLDDGRIDVVAVEPQSAWRILGRIPAFFRGTLAESPGLRMWQIATFELESDAPMAVHVDGEPRAGGTSLKLAIHSRALRVRTGPKTVKHH